MARFYWHKGTGQFEPWPDTPPRPRIYVISDVIDQPFQSMASGEWHDSKSTYYREVKSKGYEIVGNDANFASGKPDPTAGMDDAVSKAVHEVMS